MTDAEKYLEIVPSKVPWPEWEHEPDLAGAVQKARLGHDEEYEQWGLDIWHEPDQAWEAEDGYDPHVALSILQRHVREWLETRKIRVVLGHQGAWIPQGYDPEELDWYDLLGADRPNRSTYDEALIAAVKAASEEE